METKKNDLAHNHFIDQDKSKKCLTLHIDRTDREWSSKPPGQARKQKKTMFSPQPFYRTGQEQENM
jgi:hypothetical protein